MVKVNMLSDLRNICKMWGWGWRTRKGDLRTQINVIFTKVDEGR